MSEVEQVHIKCLWRGTLNSLYRKVTALHVSLGHRLSNIFTNRLAATEGGFIGVVPVEIVIDFCRVCSRGYLVDMELSSFWTGL